MAGDLITKARKLTYCRRWTLVSWDTTAVLVFRVQGFGVKDFLIINLLTILEPDVRLPTSQRTPDVTWHLKRVGFTVHVLHVDLNIWKQAAFFYFILLFLLQKLPCWWFLSFETLSAVNIPPVTMRVTPGTPRCRCELLVVVNPKQNSAESLSVRFLMVRVHIWPEHLYDTRPENCGTSVKLWYWLSSDLINQKNFCIVSSLGRL